jgi:hypothetical protein
MFPIARLNEHAENIGAAEPDVAASRHDGAH